MAKGRSMAKTNPLAKRASETDLQWRSRIAAAKQAERDKTQPLVTPEAERHGKYVDAFVVDPEGHGSTMAKVSVNRGGDPVDRWFADNRLTETQMVAINLVRHLWRVAGITQKVTASYGERIPHHANHDMRAINEIEARDDLHRIIDYFPCKYWSVFENVVRHGEAAGVAGSRLGYGSRTASERAHTIVCFVADYIAMKERI